MTGTTANTYDSGGNLKTSTDARNATATYSYDALNRVTQIAYGDQTLAYSYDAGTYGVGRLTGAGDADHSMSWQYDAQGRVASKGQVSGAVSLTVGYGYANGRLTSLTTPSGQSLGYSYGNGQIVGITINGGALLSGAAYDSFGPVRSWGWGNGTTEIRLHDADGNPSLITGVESKSYTLDNAFRIVGVTNTSNANLSWTYGYDNLDRLTTGTASSTALTWTYDANGNRQVQGGGPGPLYASGNVSFIYNNRNRMVSAISGPTTSYYYNALGQRIKKSGPGGTGLSMYDEAGHLLGEYTSAGALVQETVWLGDIPVATLRPNGGGGVDVYYVHVDHLNAPRLISRPSDNAVVWRWDADPFGTSSPNQDPSRSGRSLIT